MPNPRSWSNPSELPPVVSAFVEATNGFDLERLVVAFADDALVNGQLRDIGAKRPLEAGQNGTSLAKD